jgi:hypothetical protein
MTAPHDATPAADLAAHSPILAGFLQDIRALRAARPARATGPRTLRGKQASRKNATTHGMRCQVVAPPDDVPKIEARTAGWVADLKPRGESQTWLVGRAAELSVRLDRCSERERIALAENTAAAEHAWFQTKRAWARRLGNRLIERPEYHLARLLGSALGLDWLIARWDELARDLDDEKGYWSRAERERAVLLLGLALRETDAHNPRLRPLWVNALATDRDASPAELDWTFRRDTSHLEGEARIAEARKPLPDEETGRRDLLAIVRREQEGLRTLRAEVWESVDRPALEAACRRARTFDPSPEATLASRYERSNASELARCLNLLARLKREARQADNDAPDASPWSLDEPTSDPSAFETFETSGAPNELQDGQDCDLNPAEEATCEATSEASRASQGRPEGIAEASRGRPEGVDGASRARRRRALEAARRRRKGRRRS